MNRGTTNGFDERQLTMAGLAIGDPAPQLTLVTHTGQQISLADFRGKQPVVVFFYPMDGTPACTREACSFRDAYEDFVGTGAALIGVSASSSARHRAFASDHGLPYLLVSDRGGQVRRAFGVPRLLGFLPGRVTYVIDREGIIRHIVRAQLGPTRHVEESLEALRKLNP
jgi:peroxiredoxin Q/BCP